MSKPRKRDDAERTRIMLDLVRQKYDAKSPMSREWVACEEVADGTGWSAGRWADVLAFGIWRGTGHQMVGYEVKASRADLKKELSDLSKHEALAKYCDAWWLVAWDESVLVDGIPESWGILLTRDDAHGDRELYVKRRAGKREPVEWDRCFVASLVRNAYDQAPRASELVNVGLIAARRATREAESMASGERNTLVRPLAELFYGTSTWKWPSEARDPEQLIKRAVERLSASSPPLSQEDTPNV